MIDTHCHLYSSEFKVDRMKMIERAINAGVRAFIMPAIDGETYDEMLEIEAKFPGICYSMMGLHPCYVKEDFREKLKHARKYLDNQKFKAIGEAGLDFHWDITHKSEQYEALHTQAEWAIELNLPLVLHTRNAMQETIDVVNQYAGRGLTGIFHCFGGSVEDAKQITNAGFYLGIGGVVTYKKSGLKEVIREIGLDNLVLETDAPYLAPTPFRGKRNESSYLGYVVDALAEATGKGNKEVVECTTRNANKIFNLNIAE